MRRTGILLAAVIAIALALAPGLAFARAGLGGSVGSRGSMTYSRPPATGTAPYSAAPMQRSLTPQGAPAPGYQSGYSGYSGRSPFMSGLMGGLFGAGLAGLLFGGGLFHGINGFGGLFGFLLQIFLLVMLGRFLLRLFMGQAAFAGGNFFGRSPMPGLAPPMMGGGGPAVVPLAIAPPDYQQFEGLLQQMQAAWSAQDLHRMQTIATPEMVSYFAEQLAELTSRGLRNTVTDVRLDKGDLAEAWAEHGHEYATVAMRFSMVDVTRDQAGRVVDGDPARRSEATEIWTFLRVPGGHWILSAIQQAR
jgi:predicted lipid-binding transport protein (Tim44 family)